MYKSIVHFMKDDAGVTAIEYGLIAALVAVAFVSALLFVGGEVEVLYDAVGDKVSDPDV